MINFRSYFKSIFSGVSQVIKSGFEKVKMFNSYMPWFSNWDGDLYNQNIIRSCIHIIATHTAKLEPKLKGSQPKRLNRLKYLLKNKPNEYMTRFDFFYKVVSMLYSSNNTFIYTRYDNKGNVIGFYPVSYSQTEFYEYDNELYVKFLFKNNNFECYIPYSELIHLRRHYNDNDLFGSNPREPLRPVLEVVNASNEGMINAVRASGQLRGVLKISGNNKPEDLKKVKDEFVANYMNLNGDGIGALDSKFDFIPTKIEPIMVDDKQQKLIRDEVCMAYGISEAVLKGDYKEDQFNAFYNNAIEPLLILLSLAFTNNLYTETEIALGLEVIMSATKMTFANNATKNAVCRDMIQLGVYSTNEAREIFELEPIEGGDRRIISLNYVNFDKADKYQGIDDDTKIKKEDGESDDK